MLTAAAADKFCTMVALMIDDTPRASDAALARADGAARVGFVRDGKTRLAHLAQRSPCRIVLPNEGAEPVAVLINTAGGVCGGDKLTVAVDVDDGAAATVVGQAAEKIYRAIDRPATLTTELRADAGAALHWAPQETILFDGARLARRTTIELAPDARLLAAETLVFGRTAMGETIGSLAVRDDWRVGTRGQLRWADAFRLDGPAALSAAGGLAGHKALATLVAAGPDLAARRDDVREMLGPGVRAGATVVNGLLVVRLLGDAASVRTLLTALYETLRASLLDMAPTMPRVWTC